MEEMLQKVRERVMTHPLSRWPLLDLTKQVNPNLPVRNLQVTGENGAYASPVDYRGCHDSTMRVRCFGAVFLGAEPRNMLHTTLLCLCAISWLAFARAHVRVANIIRY